MTSAQLAKTSVDINDIPFQDYTHMDDQTEPTTIIFMYVHHKLKNKYTSSMRMDTLLSAAKYVSVNYTKYPHGNTKNNQLFSNFYLKLILPLLEWAHSSRKTHFSKRQGLWIMKSNLYFLLVSNSSVPRNKLMSNEKNSPQNKLSVYRSTYTKKASVQNQSLIFHTWARFSPFKRQSVMHSSWTVTGIFTEREEIFNADMRLLSIEIQSSWRRMSIC